MSSKCKEILDLDIYEILGIGIEATDAEVKKSFRKKALSCHPDKNPDNPAAAAEFDRLKKILEVLLDPSTRAAYDKVLRGRKLAAVRARQTSAQNQKLKHDLERREREAALVKDNLSDKERFKRELQRLEKEGEQIIAEEIIRLEREAKEERLRARSRLQGEPDGRSKAAAESSYRVKVRWVTPESATPYTKDMIFNHFYKWGDINAVVVKQKGSKGSALIDYMDKSGAEMALQYEKGLPDCPMIVSELKHSASEPAPSQSAEGKAASDTAKRDYEALADMEKRRKNERARLIAEMLRADGVLEPDEA
ncbi:dnaJ homolog subfamily C member 17 [Hyalella azteca]|uniref:DnaJ homolog subfamily C member 17 n=1 Tax=Hyalella azteca TaxID=294128 RepID=A0A8B7NMF6_HYAAZ|nr:dnaJ homolog subfamily C member 17 [Hyalella azteca]